jgi:murein DD-endopeptidase MepM/ murein hydrolase activator NlpD
LLSKIEVGDKIKILISEKGELDQLLYQDNIREGVKAEKKDNDFIIKKYKSEIEKVKVFKHVVIEDSMYMSGLRENVPDSVLMDLAYINGWDIDFTHDIRPGDTFSIIYEEIIIDGEKVIDGDILISEFNNRGKQFVAVRFDLDTKTSEYFDINGENVKKAFLRSPVKLSYISSKYNLKRRHPVLHTIRAHKGVDYAANKGSPVRATGDGTILFAQYNGGCGNEIKIKHSEDYVTRYCHLDRFGKRAKVGRKVKQGQTIGYVGSTGLATGPHLHYEFHVNGKHTDPLKVKFPNASPVKEKQAIAYERKSQNLLNELNNYKYLIDRGEVYGG